MPLPRTPKPRPRNFSCPNCNGAVRVRYPGRAMSVVCERCLSVLDVSTPTVALLQAYERKIKKQPRVPLGTKITLRGYTGELVGFQVREGRGDGETFRWDEYLLYNPYHGYRFLAETVVGWTFVGQTMEVPRSPANYPGSVSAGGTRYALSEVYTAETLFVFGEFYWKVAVGHRVVCKDFAAGRKLLVSETVEDEFNWSMGEKIPAHEVFKAMVLKMKPPVYETEPTKVSPIVLVVVVIVLLVMCVIIAVAAESGGGSFRGGK